ncbi:MAG: NAD-dependent epimerase/dehydratase family protein [Gammaproteobacteria bacterium]
MDPHYTHGQQQCRHGYDQKQEIVIAKILITGATGFVGSHVLESLMLIRHTDLDIVAACRQPERLIPSYSGEVRVGDLRDPHYLDRVLTGIDVVCHCAGWTSFTNDEAACQRLYLEPSLDLINHAKQWQVSRFINLSSLALAPIAKRHHPMVKGKPRRHAPMFNCMIAVEEYLQASANERFTVVNLRLGSYSGRRLNLCLLRYLLNGSPRLPAIGGRYGYLPLVDGRDIGQAFARASLAPLQQCFTSLNIVGPTVPSQREVYRYINEIQGRSSNTIAWPLAYIKSMGRLQQYLGQIIHGSSWPEPLLQLLANPTLDNHLAQSNIGYDPQYYWKHSLMDSIKQPNPLAGMAVYSVRDDGMFFPP